MDTEEINAGYDTAESDQADESLYCVICRKQIDPKRATRPTATCSEVCKNRLDTIKANQRKARKCPHCLHPSTPEEREQFRLWRADRGEVRSTAPTQRDRTLPNKNLLMRALKSAVTQAKHWEEELRATLDTAEDEEARANLAAKLEKLSDRVQDWRSLVDKPQA